MKDWLRAIFVTLALFGVVGLSPFFGVNALVTESSLNADAVKAATAAQTAAMDPSSTQSAAPSDAKLSAPASDAPPPDNNQPLERARASVSEWILTLCGLGVIVSLGWHAVALTSSAAGKNAGTSLRMTWFGVLLFLLVSSVVWAWIHVTKTEGALNLSVAARNSTIGAGLGGVAVLYWLSTALGARSLFVRSVPLAAVMRGG